MVILGRVWRALSLKRDERVPQESEKLTTALQEVPEVYDTNTPEKIRYPTTEFLEKILGMLEGRLDGCYFEFGGIEPGVSGEFVRIYHLGFKEGNVTYKYEVHKTGKHGIMSLSGGEHTDWMSAEEGQYVAQGLVNWYIAQQTLKNAIAEANSRKAAIAFISK